MVRYTKSIPKYTKIWLDMAYMLSSKKQTFAYENRPMRISSFLISYFRLVNFFMCLTLCGMVFQKNDF